jgi:hypothetical protein
MRFTASGSLERHLYVNVIGEFVGVDGLLPAVWFGLHSHPGRAWGCTVMLECGAVYRNLPPHAITFGNNPIPWSLQQAQLWDCYGTDFSLHIYRYLDGLDAIAMVQGDKLACSYLFTAIPVGDGFTHEPTQDKEFMFLRTDSDMLTIQPTNRVVFVERSFTDDEAPIPKLKVTSEVYSCEGGLGSA